MKVNRLIFSIFISFATYAAVIYLNEPADGFYSYVKSKGIDIEKLFSGGYRISYLNWTCDIDTSVAKNFIKRNISWKDMFETRIDVVSEKTTFSPNVLRKKMAVLPEDGTPIILVARQGNVSIPKENVIIRLNNHGPTDARTSMVICAGSIVKALTNLLREHPADELITRPRNIRPWNTSHPLVIPENRWNLPNLKYYRGPLFFLKGIYLPGHMAKCNPGDGIGLRALNKIANLKGDISTLGFSTSVNNYNTQTHNRFKLLAHKLVWSYFVVKELTDTL